MWIIRLDKFSHSTINKEECPAHEAHSNTRWHKTAIKAPHAFVLEGGLDNFKGCFAVPAVLHAAFYCIKGMAGEYFADATEAATREFVNTVLLEERFVVCSEW